MSYSFSKHVTVNKTEKQILKEIVFHSVVSPVLKTFYFLEVILR